MRVHLVDGTYELFRAYYGAPSRAGRDGAEIGAARALLGSLLSLVTKEGATHVAVAFDHVIESFRNELFAGYKTGEGIDPDLLAQFPLAEAVVRALGMVCWPMVAFEADDALATAAARFGAEPRVEEVQLCSPDKDLMQCVSGVRVVVVDRRRRRTYDAAGVVEKLEVPPESVPDYLALVGDDADGIPGLPRWGAKSAAAVLSTYGHVERIPDDAARWSVKVRGAAALAASLTEHRAEAELYRVLATLRTDVPLTESVDALEWRGADRAAVEALAAAFDDTALLDRIPRWADS